MDRQLTDEEIEARVTYHPPSVLARERHEVVRGAFRVLMGGIARTIPAGREAALAMTKLEEALFWSNAAIARNHGRLE